MQITQIVPRLPPAVDGLGDYALNLARQFLQQFGTPSHLIVGDPHWTGATTIEDFAVSQVKHRSPEQLLALLSGDHPVVLLHYVGYGYARKGYPLWLVQGLERWKAAHPQARFVVMFHELHAFGPPWHSVFWLSPFQRDLVIRLARLSDACLTNSQKDADRLQSFLTQSRSVTILPVFSNIGEPSTIPPLTARTPRLVLFGQAYSKQEVYQRFQAQLMQTCQQLGIQEIWDIGPTTGLAQAAIAQIPVRELGKLPAQEISQILLDSQVGFFRYAIDRLPKSTVFAAYCSHGVLPVNPQGSAKAPDGIELGQHYWSPGLLTNDKLDSLDGLQAIANHAYDWYHRHQLATQAQVFFDQLQTRPTMTPGG